MESVRGVLLSGVRKGLCRFMIVLKISFYVVRYPGRVTIIVLRAEAGGVAVAVEDAETLRTTESARGMLSSGAKKEQCSYMTVIRNSSYVVRFWGRFIIFVSMICGILVEVVVEVVNVVILW